jgi:hypothetical protein
MCNYKSLLTRKVIFDMTYRITRGLIVTRPNGSQESPHLRTNGFLSSLLVPTYAGNLNGIFVFLFTRQFRDMQYSTSNPVRTEFHFSALHHGDYDVLWGAELWFVVCGCVLVR